MEGLQQNVLMARAVVIPSNNMVPVCIANTDTLTVTLHEGHCRYDKGNPH